MTPFKIADLQVSGFITQKQIDKLPLLIGRSPECHLVLNHPQVSGFHARLVAENGAVAIEDLGSSNGTYLSNSLIRRALLRPGDTILILPFFLIFTGAQVNVYSIQRESQLLAWQITVQVATKKILDRVTLTCGSNELVGFIGPSGSGKTTLMKCLSGQILPSSGRVQLNDLELFSHFNSLKHNIGFVPQDDILHRELTVQQTLMYAAQLRLPVDMSEKERKTRVWETLIEMELEEQERLSVSRLSGGQRKRVNVAIELLTKPGILFLDEPTSGLDPALDEKLMTLFKKLSQDGRITVVTTHLMENADMFSRIAIMHYGRLIFYGSPQEARSFFHVTALSQIYNQLKERPAEEWQDDFQKTKLQQKVSEQVRDRVLPSRRTPGELVSAGREPPIHALSQWRILSQRYLHIILRDQKNTGILLLQAPVIAMFIIVATTNLSSRLFMMTLAALWFGCNNSAREICKEFPIYRRERMINLAILPYLGSKFVVLSGLVVLQCIVLALLTPHDALLIYWPLILCGFAGVALGLCVSSIVDSPDKATALIPILLIPQVLFAGIFGELHGGQRLVGEVMISKWSYNLVKKEFNLPSLQQKDALERRIDDSQQIMKESQEQLQTIQQNLQNTLDEMENTYDPMKLDRLRSDARRRMSALREEQQTIRDARQDLDEAEKELRRKAKLFVWIDRPDSDVDAIALVVFTLFFLACSAYQLKRKDHTFKLL